MWKLNALSCNWVFYYTDTALQISLCCICILYRYRFKAPPTAGLSIVWTCVTSECVFQLHSNDDDNCRFQNLNVYDCVTKSTMSISACMFSECQVWSVGQLVHFCFKFDNVLLFVFTVEISCYVKIDNYSPWAMYYCWPFEILFCEPVFSVMCDFDITTRASRDYKSKINAKYVSFCVFQNTNNIQN